jgi:hypothetical protein
MKKLLASAAVGEAAIGLVLFVYPPIVVRLLFGTEITGAGIVISRMAGIILVALGIAYWPTSDINRTFYGMLGYSTLAMLYLAYVGVNSGGGILLWPAVAAHAGLSIFLVRARWKEL